MVRDVYILLSCQGMSYFYNSIVPSSPPVNITVMSAHPESLELSWQPPPEIYRNGPIIGYEIQYTMVGSTVAMDEVIGSRNAYTIIELLPFVNYSIVIAAITVNGTGPFSAPVIELSGPEGKGICPKGQICSLITQ